MIQTEHKTQFSEIRKHPESIASKENWPRQHNQLTVLSTDEEGNETGWSKHPDMLCLLTAQESLPSFHL